MGEESWRLAGLANQKPPDDTNPPHQPISDHMYPCNTNYQHTQGICVSRLTLTTIRNEQNAFVSVFSNNTHFPLLKSYQQQCHKYFKMFRNYVTSVSLNSLESVRLVGRLQDGHKSRRTDELKLTNKQTTTILLE